jgi:hypothetical protein
LTPLNDTDLARLHEEHTKLSLDIQSTLLRDNQPIAIRVHRRSLLHARVCQERVDSEALAKGWVTRPGDGLETRNEVNFAIGRDIEGQPGKLCRGDMDAWIDGQEV